MESIEAYFTREGWKADLEKTFVDIKDLSILVKRTIGLSEYGYKSGQEMTSKEREDLLFVSKSLWFDSEREFQIYAMTNKFPLGPCLIYEGKASRRFDDSI